VAGPVLALVLLPVFLSVSFSAGRVGWAAVNSPWRLTIYPPPAEAAQVAGYARALALSPLDPDFLYPCGASLVAALRDSPPEGRGVLAAELEQILAAMEQVNPRDYLRPWLAGQAALVQGDGLRAAEGVDLAAALAPSYEELHLQAACIRLTWLFAKAPPSGPERRAHLRRILEHFRFVLRVLPWRENDVVGWLEAAGAAPMEIVELWPPDDPRSVLPRLRYWVRLSHWGLAEAEAERLSPETATNPWCPALLGLTAFGQDQLEAGLEHWRTVLARLSHQKVPDVEDWLAHAAGRLSAPAALAVAERLTETATRLPAFAAALAVRLIQAGQYGAADRLAGLAAERCPTAEVYQAWAEAAAGLKDYRNALARLRHTWELSNRAEHWRPWVDGREKEWAPKVTPP
jgi:tetratricopeptide (TPR) repeat protein